jgi:UDP-N-acetyl-D-glucosamine dehydrogenase
LYDFTMASVSQKSLAIIGQGYVGLPLAMAAVESGWTVIGLDNSASRVENLNLGQSPVEDISNETLANALKSGSYRASSNFEDISNADVVTICVPTPLDEKKEPDLSALRGATNSVAPFLKNGALLVSESTSYPGTLRNEVIPIVKKNRSTGTIQLFFATAPERVNPGDLVWNQKNTPRLVSGIDKESHEKALDFYGSICDAVISAETPEIAEAAKLLENTFRLVNIGLINEFTKLCGPAGIDVNKVVTAAASKPYGFMPFRPGVGVGGHCIPVDPLYLTWWAKQNNLTSPIVELAEKMNSEMHKYVADRALKLVKSNKKKVRILLLGVAYKAGVSDVRETPASHLREYLTHLGHVVEWIDPLVTLWENTNPTTDLQNFDVAIVAVNQPGLPIANLQGIGTPILDCTNSFSGQNGIENL